MNTACAHRRALGIGESVAEREDVCPAVLNARQSSLFLSRNGRFGITRSADLPSREGASERHIASNQPRPPLSTLVRTRECILRHLHPPAPLPFWYPLSDMYDLPAASSFKFGIRVCNSVHPFSLNDLCTCYRYVPTLMYYLS